MKTSEIHSYDELPLFLNAKTAAQILGVSPSTCYEMMRRGEIPSLRIGSRVVIPKADFILWIENHTKGGIR